VVDDKELLARLSRSKEHGSDFLKNAPLAIVVCADEAKSDVWVEDCSISAILLQMTALSLGLGSCWIQIRKRKHDNRRSSEEYIRETLSLPEYLKVASIIAIGHPAEIKMPKPAAELQYEKIKRNSYL
jgi:nitroreductase